MGLRGFERSSKTKRETHDHAEGGAKCGAPGSRSHAPASDRNESRPAPIPPADLATMADLLAQLDAIDVSGPVPPADPVTVADADLAAVIAAWPDLPPAIRAGVMALVRTTMDG